MPEKSIPRLKMEIETLQDKRRQYEGKSEGVSWTAGLLGLVVAFIFFVFWDYRIACLVGVVAFGILVIGTKNDNAKRMLENLDAQILDLREQIVEIEEGES